MTTAFRKSQIFGLTLSLGFAVPCFAHKAYLPCTSETAAGSVCEDSVLELHPTQMSVGMIEVKEKEKEIDLIKNDPEKLFDFEEKNPEPSVIGPKGVVYIYDHHHLARAMADEGVTTTLCLIKYNYASKGTKDFWDAMKDDHYVYPYDQNGAGPFPYADIPSDVSKLKDDPYRSLAGGVEKAGGYDKKKDVAFQEFLWADFFRKYPVDPIKQDLIENDFKKAVTKGVAQAKTADAKDLPGYKGAN